MTTTKTQTISTYTVMIFCEDVLMHHISNPHFYDTYEELELYVKGKWGVETTDPGMNGENMPRVIEVLNKIIGTSLWHVTYLVDTRDIVMPVFPDKKPEQPPRSKPQNAFDYTERYLSDYSSNENVAISNDLFCIENREYGEGTKDRLYNLDQEFKSGVSFAQYVGLIQDSTLKAIFEQLIMEVFPKMENMIAIFDVHQKEYPELYYFLKENNIEPDYRDNVDNMNEHLYSFELCDDPEFNAAISGLTDEGKILAQLEHLRCRMMAMPCYAYFRFVSM